MPDVLYEVVEQIELLETAEQGPPGPPGPASGGETSPVLTRVDGLLTRIDYASGNYRVLSYTGTRLDRVDYVQGPVTKRRVLNYALGGELASVTDSVT